MAYTKLGYKRGELITCLVIERHFWKVSHGEYVTIIARGMLMKWVNTISFCQWEIIRNDHIWQLSQIAGSVKAMIEITSYRVISLLDVLFFKAISNNEPSLMLK